MDKKNQKKTKSKNKTTKQEEHLGCYSYPNCDIDPLGCRKIYKDKAEPYGHR